MDSYEELTARWSKAVADLEARVDEYQEMEKDEAELVGKMTAYKAKLVELKAMCHEKNKDKKKMISDILSLEKKALKLKKMREEKVRRDEEPTEARSRLISE